MYAHYQHYQNQNHQYYQQQQQQQQPPPPEHQNQIVPPNPVQTFTQYYHGWIRRVNELKNPLSSKQHSDRQTIESDRQWAQYYAEESSRAAHHFHQNPHAKSAPFTLPPAPPNAVTTRDHNQNNNFNNNKNRAVNKTYASAARSATDSSTNNNNNSNNNNSNNNNKPSTSASTSSNNYSNNPPGSITRYVKRSMERHQVQNNPILKKHVQAEIEKVIAAAIQAKTLQSKNWDLVPLIALPGAETGGASGSAPTPAQAQAPAPAQAQDRYRQHQQHQQHQQSYNGRHYYEHKSSVRVAPSHKSNYYGSTGDNNGYNHYGSNATSGSKAESNGSYYGPSSPRNSNNKIQNSNNHSTHNFRQHAGHGNKHNGNSLSSSPFTGPNKKQKNGKRHHDEDTSVTGHYGPAATGSGSSPRNSNSSKKKAKKNQWKNPDSFSTAGTGSMYNDGLDYSEQAMAKRASRFSGRGGIREATSANVRIGKGIYGGGSGSSNHDRYMGKGTIGGDDVTLSETDFEQMTVKGTSTTLEKNYLRLTAPPRAELVRPLGILQKHLRNLQREYYGSGSTELLSENQSSDVPSVLRERMQTPQAGWTMTDDDREMESVPNGSSDLSGRRKRRDYLWFCSQLKAIRQDCTVQRIQGDLAVDVYETHARIALQEGDLNEYNQCQTQLKELYKNLPSTDSRNRSVLVRDNSDESDWKHQQEFIAYRLLYYVFLSTNEKYSGGSSDMYHIMLSLTPTERKHPAINHALKVREAVALSDYFWFFRLHKTSPNLGIFLTELLVPTMRLRGLRRIAKAYRPSIDLNVCFEQLGFCDQNHGSCADDGETTIDDGGATNDGKDGGKMMEDAKSWLISCGGIIDGSKFLTKDSDIHAPVTKDAKKNSLI